MTAPTPDGRDIDQIIHDLETTLTQLRAVRDAERGTADLRARLDAIQRRRSFRIIRGGLAAIVGLAGLAAWQRLLRAAYLHPIASAATTLAVGTAIGVGVTAGVGASVYHRNAPYRPSVAAPAAPQPMYTRHASPRPSLSATPQPSGSTVLTPPLMTPPGIPGTPTVLAPTIPTPMVPVPTHGHGHGRTHTPARGVGDPTAALGRNRRRKRGGKGGRTSKKPASGPCLLPNVLGLVGVQVCQ